MNLFLFFLLFFIAYSIVSWIMYKKRSETFVIIDFDSVIVDIEHIIKRAKIYVENNPDKTIGEYVGAHISEQIIKPNGILEALKYQQACYKLVFMSARHENLRVDTAKILNEWNLHGVLFMNQFSLDPVLFKSTIIRAHLEHGCKIHKVIDWS